MAFPRTDYPCESLSSNHLYTKIWDETLASVAIRGVLETLFEVFTMSRFVVPVV